MRFNGGMLPLRSSTLAALALVACGEVPPPLSSGASEVACMRDARLTPYSPGMQVWGEAGFSVHVVESTPAVPARFDNRLVVEVIGPDGAPSADALLAVTTHMPLAGLGADEPATVTPDGAGRFVVDPVRMPMPGLWEIRFLVTQGAARDLVALPLCIPG